MTETGAPGPRRNDPPPPRPESPIQFIQGCYYLIAGVGVAIGLTTLQSVTGPPTDLPHLWIARVLGAAVAAAGVGLIIASRRVDPIRIAVGGPMLLALVLTLINTLGVATGSLPKTFLLDIGMELGFLTWWACELYLAGRPIAEPHPEPRMVRA